MLFCYYLIIALPYLNKIASRLTICEKEVNQYGDCIKKKGLGTNQYNCEKEFSLMNNCLHKNN